MVRLPLGGRRILQGVLGAARQRVAAVTYLLQDEFTTNEGAPLTTPRTCEPGPGTLNVTGTNAYSIVGSRLDFAAGGTGNILSSTTFTRAAGLCGAVYATAAGGGGSGNFGFCNGALYGTSIYSGLVRYTVDAAPWVVTVYTGSPLNLPVYQITRGTGNWIVLNDTLLWISDDDSSNRQFLHRGNYTITLEYMRVTQLPTPWDTDYGIATQRLAGARTPGDTFTHEADCLIEYEVTTLPATGQSDMAMRQQDDNNRWRSIYFVDGKNWLYEVVGGGHTLRASAGAGSVSNGSRVVHVCDDDDITTYSDNTQLYTYGSATNFKTETSGKVHFLPGGSSFSDIIAWPRTLSGTALTTLQAVTA